ncbi:Ankyrin repeat domain containing protein [Pandoravirus dulcis]|uniref:Ankyrin repeat domain containing protein n=1 Tax=Pandoravirus dulcis TaxID=1349409 RepID=S4VY43_9VIRU|nr:Ankyrin repeat domain containing protein [Pandoravirus dulcis]AGO82961.1 Ankyrin repeat domain containing protein [Pandoravirus dulcis]
MASDDDDLLRLFLDNDDDGISAIEQGHVRDAARRGNIDVLRLLAERGYGPWPDHLVVCAVHSRRLDIVQFACGLGADVDHVALVCAVRSGCADILAFLCDRGRGACPRMAMRAAVAGDRSDIVRLLRDREDIGVCRGGAHCCEADPVSLDISREPTDIDALFAYCSDVCSGWRALRDAASFKNDDLFRRIVAEHQHNDIDIRCALADSLDAADRRAIRRIVAHFGDRLASMEWPSRLVDLCQSGRVPLAPVEVLADCAPYLCTPEDVVRRASPWSECGVEGECAAEDHFRRMLCARLSRSSDAMDTT